MRNIESGKLRRKNGGKQYNGYLQEVGGKLKQFRWNGRLLL